MKHLFMFLKGLVSLGVTVVLVYYGMVLLNEWNYGFKGIVAAIVIFPLVLMGAGYATKMLTFGKLGNAASIFFTIFVLMCIGAVQKYNYEKKQIEGYQAAADTLGLEYSMSVAVDSTFGNNPILRTGYLRTAHNALTGKYHDVDVMLFNFQYEMESGDNTDHYFRTVVVFEDSARNIPEFQMEPEGWGDRMFGLFGDGGDIDFPDDPDFSKRYCLAGPDSQAVRDLFGSAPRGALVLSDRNWSVAGVGHRVIIYADDRMDEEVKPNVDAVREYLEQAWYLYMPIRSAAPMHEEE